MSNDPDNGGDISSGFGDSTVTGPVSDEKAERMKRTPANQGRAAGADDAEADDSEQDQAADEQSPTPQ